MNAIFSKSILIGAVLASLSIFANPTGIEASSKEHKHSISDYIPDFPWIGLITDEINYGPITISHLNLNDDGRLTILSPGETIEGKLHYKINADHLKSFHLYHLVIGLKGEGPQDCVSHSFGLWDSKGKGKFEITAPTTPGIYEVRISYYEGLTCNNARDSWNVEGEPSSVATIGVIIVE